MAVNASSERQRAGGVVTDLDGRQKVILSDASGNPSTPAGQPAGAAGLSNVPSSATSVTLAAANPNRRGLLIYNDSTSVLFVKLGAAASSSSYTVQVAANGYYELPQPIYIGIVDGVWAAANGNARVTELT